MNNNIASYINNTLDFIYSNITFEAFVGLCVVYFFIIWIALIIWIIRDIRDRTDSIWFLILSISIILIGTPLSIFLYLIIRPGKTFSEKYYEEIEENLDIIAEFIKKQNKKKKSKKTKNKKK